MRAHVCAHVYFQSVGDEENPIMSASPVLTSDIPVNTANVCPKAACHRTFGLRPPVPNFIL